MEASFALMSDSLPRKSRPPARDIRHPSTHESYSYVKRYF